MTKKAELAPAAPTGITPDEVLLLRRRQEWRGRILKICIGILRQLAPQRLDDDDGEAGPWRRFLDLSAEIERDMRRLLESEMVVAELEMHRHGANYFLDTLIRQVRDQQEGRARIEGSVNALGPLEALGAAELEQEVRAILGESPDSLQVFVNDLTQIQQFELEVQRQRRRLQFLLGCDRALRDLAESNAEIIESTYDEFQRIVREFSSYCRAIDTELAPLLEVPSPYERLQQELDNSRDQLRWLADSVFKPTEELRSGVDELERRLGTVGGVLTRLLARVGELEGLGQPADGPDDGPANQRHAAELKSRLISLKDELLAVNATPLRELCETDRKDLEKAKLRLRELLGPLEEQLIKVETELVDPGLELLRRREAGEIELDSGASLRLHSAVKNELSELDQHLSEVLEAVANLRDRNLLLLKERICQDLGFVRTTFLQPSFAHIAAEDPRSIHTAQYFYLKEFADEAERSQQLLEAAHVLWQELERAQSTHIRGLRFTANNLNKIADRVLLERHTVPSGPGWRELAGFLEYLKDRLVPRLRMICTLPGVRFDDKDQLTRYAGEISEACSMLLAQRETAYRLMREIERTAESEGATADRAHYEEIILRITCEDMAVKLRRVSRTLVELVPYVGAMVGSIRMRTSLSFQRQLESRDPRLRPLSEI